MIDYTYTYFSIPVYGNLRLGRKGIFSIGVGGYSSLLIKQIRTDINPSSQNVGTHDETSLNSPFDFGLCAQIKCLLPSIAGHQLSLRFQETYGLFNTRPNTYSGQAFHSQNMLVIIRVSIFKKSK